MLEAILSNHYITLSFATTGASLLKYSKYFESKLKYFPILLMYIFLTELLGLIIRIDPSMNPIFTNFYSKYNFIIYNLYDIIFFGYFYYLLWHCCISKINKSFILYGTIVYSLAFIINCLLTNIITEPQLYSYNIGCIVLILSIILFLKENIKNKFFKKNVLFWICLGLLIFHIGFIPINILYSFSTISIDTKNYILPKIHLALVFLMYGSFIYGFIQMKGKLKL